MGQEWNWGVQFIDLCRTWGKDAGVLGTATRGEAHGFRSGQQGWRMMCMWEWGEDSGTFLGFWSEQQGDRDSMLTTILRCLCHTCTF